MECNRGSICTESEHIVKTISKAIEWFPNVKESQLPLYIHQYKALNGRIHARIYDQNKELISTKG